MPFPNEHACRLRDPGDFEADSFRRTQREHEGKPYSVIMGRLEGEETMTEQAYRYPKDDWSAGEARSHCQDHDGSFEAAAESFGAAPILTSATGVERRTVAVKELRVLDGEGETPSLISGYAALFGALSEDLGGFRERINPGAFAKTVQEADVRALWQHDVNYVLGRTKSGTLELSEDEKGLAFTIKPPEAQWARDALVTMRRGDVDQMSFGFEAVRDEWEQEAGGEAIRTLVEVKLFDVSPVTFPAYPQTSAEVRARAEQITSTPGQAAHLEDDADGEAARARLDLYRRRLKLMQILFGGERDES